jgi:hypothetical protein
MFVDAIQCNALSHIALISTLQIVKEQQTGHRPSLANISNDRSSLMFASKVTVRLVGA